jgi:hypothetical protein
MTIKFANGGQLESSPAKKQTKGKKTNKTKQNNAKKTQKEKTK